MNFSLIDALGLTLATLSFVPLLLLPGWVIAQASGVLGFRTAPADEKALLAVVIGAATLPAITSVATRFAGLDGALWLTLDLAGVAVVILIRTARWPLMSRPGAILIGVWFALVVFEWIDLDIAGKLYQPYTMIDTVKHAATTQAIRDTGAPPEDPFFFRPERVGYYYFFYTLPALCERLLGGLIDAKAAVGGLVVWTGLALYGMARLVLERGGFVEGPGGLARARILLIIGLAASGLDVIYIAARGLSTGVWLGDPAQWNEQVASWFESVIWVPHHVTGLIALFVGLMAAVDAMTRRPIAAAGPILIAGVCFAAMLGLSVWVALAGATTALVWFALLAVERRWRAVIVLASVGIVAAMVAAPQLADLARGRAGGGVPIGLTVRAFWPLDPFFAPGAARSAMRLFALPLNYFAEFGVLFLGTIVFWRHHRVASVHANELARVLTIAAATGLCLGTFLRSLIFNNDLGWRVVLLPLLAGLVWSVAAVERRWAERPKAARHDVWRAAPASMVALLAIGYATTVYAVVGLRAYYAVAPALPRSAQLFAEHRETARALREAYTWANANLPGTVVLQHDPNAFDSPRRAIAFGLYSRHRVAVGDNFAALFGAGMEEVEDRLDHVLPIFTESLPDAEVRARARETRIDALVVTADDPVWRVATSWVWRATPVYTSELVRIVPVSAIGEDRVGSLR